MKKLITSSLLFLTIFFLFHSCKKEKNEDNLIKVTSFNPNFEGNWKIDKTYLDFDSEFLGISANSEATYQSSGSIYSETIYGNATISNNILKIGSKSFAINKYPSNFYSTYWEMILNGNRYIANKYSSTTPECNTVQICIVNKRNINITGNLDGGSSSIPDTIPPGGVKCYNSEIFSTSTWGNYSITCISCETYFEYN